MPLPSNAHLIVHGFIGYCNHRDYPLGVKTLIGYLDFGVVNGVTGLSAWPTAKFPFPPAQEPKRGGTLAWGLPIEGRETDANPVVPHVPVAPWLAVGPLLAATILSGRSTILMGSNRTRISSRSLAFRVEEEEKAVGCCVFPYIPISLNLQCWAFDSEKLDQVEAPMMSDVVVAPNRVQVGVQLSDYLAVILDWALEVIIAFAIAFVLKPKPGAKPDSLKKIKAKKYAVAFGKVAYKLVAKTQWFQETVVDPLPGLGQKIVKKAPKHL
jgi:hypothetical protein